MRIIYIMQYYSAVKMNGMPLYTTQMNLTDSMLNQSNQTQKSTQYTHTHTHPDTPISVMPDISGY